MTRWFLRLTCCAACVGFCLPSVAEPVALRSDDGAIELLNGSLATLIDRSGRRLVKAPREPRGAGIHLREGSHWAASTARVGDAMRLEKFAGLDQASVNMIVRHDGQRGEWVVSQRAVSPAKGLWGVSWSIADIPLDYAILVPGGSGLRLTADSPGGLHQYDYPMSWEAQLVVVEGPGHGFYVWAEDAKGRFKRLTVERRASGWRLGLTTLNNAPFDNLTECESVAWRLGVYEGDWRVPARRYRDWSEAHFRPTPVERQQPSWVRDIRACVIMGLDQAILEALPKRLDPRQTLLYLPDWRTAGYDRDYPEYDKPVPQLDPFIKRAHELGFRVMLHVNYFGVDPLNPLYQEFEPYQVRDPFGNHEKQWWLWTRADPVIKFAYINPALKKWRDHFTAAMANLCRRTGADALHLDQTLCIYNDHNGLIDGLTMIEGNIALHRQLREALPDVALSGEGLNEVTCRYEAFAQRHVWGLDHTQGRWHRPWLEASHPISSYLLRPYTVIYGYLGCAPPEQDQLYAAWREAYEHWGVIPTLKPSLASLAEPTGFARQFFDEAAFWQRERVEIDMDGPWPSDVAFPLRTADGRRAAHTTDGRLVCGEREISRAVSGVNRIEGPGTIPGWRAFDDKRLFGLDPERWYPYFSEPRKASGLHVCQLPEGLIVEAVIETPDLAMVRTRTAVSVVADLGRMIERAVCGTRPFEGQGVERPGPLTDSTDGGQFQGDSGGLSAHPPWKIGGSGVAFARYEVDLPAEGRIDLIAEVALDPGAVGADKSDGVTFGASAQSGDRKIDARLHNATAERRPLRLDLTPLAGKRTTIELSVDPGPKRNPSFDWARWFRPRIERHMESQGTLALAGGKPWRVALGPSGPVAVHSTGNVHRVEAPLPGTVFFLDKEPEPAKVPLDLARHPWHLLLISDSGQEVSSAARFVGVSRQRNTVGGTARDGLFAHPPDHGRAVALFPMRLPGTPARFTTHVGIRDNSCSDGVIFVVEINGREVARRRMMPGKWESLCADLAPWAGKPVVLTLVTDSDGPFTCDWAAWGEPRIE